MNRLPLALFLSALVLIGWSFLVTPPEPAEGDTLQELNQGPPVESIPSAEVDTSTAPSTEGATASAPAVGPAGDVGPGRAGPIESGVEETLVLEVGTPGQPGSYHAVFTNRGAALIDLRLGNFYDKVGLEKAERVDREHWVHLLDGVPTEGSRTSSLLLRTSTSSVPLVSGPLATSIWEMREIERGVEFALEHSTGIRLVKRITFQPGSYELALELEVENKGYATPGKATFYFTPAEVVPPEHDERFYLEPQAVAAGRSAKDAARRHPGLPAIDSVPKKDKYIDGAFDIPTEVMSFAGVHNKYFAFLMRGAEIKDGTTIRGAQYRSVLDLAWVEENPAKSDRGYRLIVTDVLVELTVPPIGETSRAAYSIYAGPKERDALMGAHPDYEALLRKDVDAWVPGVESVATLLINVLRFLAGLTGNWGIAIILMTIMIRAVLFPLNRRSQTSMARYQKVVKKLQPKIDEIKKKYEKDLDKQRKAQAELMQKEGAMPPLGGCLPIFVQLPVFFGLFTAVRTSFDLRHKPFFGWIEDLSMPDQFMRLDLNTGLPLIGYVEYLNILPPLMVALWVGQQMVMPKPADEQARQMQKMMMFMPLVMGIFLYNYASGLSLYMITQSFLGIIEIGVIKRVWPVDDTVPEKKKDGFLTRMAAKQQEQMKRMEELKRQQSATRKGGGGKARAKAKGKGKRR